MSKIKKIRIILMSGSRIELDEKQIEEYINLNDALDKAVGGKKIKHVRVTETMTVKEYLDSGLA